MNYVHVGFTGTRHGMTDAQRESVRLLLARYDPGQIVGHHGDCVGADAEFHSMLAANRVVVHPPLNARSRAWCQVDPLDRMPPRPSPIRNASIVEHADLVIAAPLELAEKQRGDTWATIGMARRAGKPLAIVWRDGVVDSEDWHDNLVKLLG